MLNRNEMRQAKKVVEAIANNNKAVRFALDGVIIDVASGMWADDMSLIPMLGAEGTVGAVRRVPDWQHDPLIVDHLIASVQGRMIQAALIQLANINPAASSPQQLVELLTKTNDQQRAILVDICGKEKAEKHWAEQEEAKKKHAEEALNRGSVEF